MGIRALRADEVDCRVQTVKQNGCSILLYKDARCDMNILDETFGPMGWKRSHQLIDGRLYCTVEVWDAGKQMWIAKQDVGTESNTEKEKGQASDSFKRACFNIGIGRELYTAPFVWVPAERCHITPKGQGYTCYDRFAVSGMEVQDGKIVYLEIVNLSAKNAVVYRYDAKPDVPEGTKPVPDPAKEYIDNKKILAIMATIKKKGVSAKSLLQAYHLEAFNEMTMSQWLDAMGRLDKFKDKENENE